MTKVKINNRLGHNERIRVYQNNRYYWQYKGKPVLLLGGSKEDNLFQIKDLEEHLDCLQKAGGNYVRCTMSCRDEGDVWPYKKKKEGKYNLDQWNQEFWSRFNNFLKQTYKRDIIVQIELWATFDYYRTWSDNPFNPLNNINFNKDNSNLPISVTPDPPLNQNSFFWSVPELGYLEEVLYYQCCFVDKILSYSLEYPNVLYCIDNETHAPAQWANFWSGYIRNEALKKGYRINTGEMYWQKDLLHPQHRDVYNNRNLFTFWDVSQNNLLKGQPYWNHDQEGQVHWEKAIKARELLTPPRPMNNVKIYGADGEKGFDNVAHAVERFWRNIFGGMASARFHRPPAGMGLNERVQNNLKAAREILSNINIFNCNPMNNLLSNRNENEAYLLANPGKEYAVYFPDGGQVFMDVPKKNYICRWYNIKDCNWEKEEKINNKKLLLNTPNSDSYVAVIK